LWETQRANYKNPRTKMGKTGSGWGIPRSPHQDLAEDLVWGSATRVSNNEGQHDGGGKIAPVCGAGGV